MLTLLWTLLNLSMINWLNNVHTAVVDINVLLCEADSPFTEKTGQPISNALGASQNSNWCILDFSILCPSAHDPETNQNLSFFKEVPILNMCGEESRNEEKRELLGEACGINTPQYYKLQYLYTLIRTTNRITLIKKTVGQIKQLNKNQLICFALKMDVRWWMESCLD